MNGEASSSPPDRVRFSFLQVLLIGLRLIPGEIFWNIIRRLRVWEIRQMQKRLDREYQTFGRLSLAAEHSSQSSQELEKELELARKQIDFLQKEVSFLQKELQNLRQSLIKKRRQKWAV